MRTSGTCAWLIWLSVALLGECALADILTTKSGNQYEGTVTEDGNSYNVVKPDGGKMTLPKSMVSRVEKGSLPASPTVNPPTPGPAVKPEAGPKGRSTVDISDRTGAKDTPSGEEKLIERVVTGVGTDPDKALQAAFSQAIESAVGVMVDAETVVKNDQIIKDQILTYSKGFVQKYDVVKQWQADGLHHATIKALVETGKLTDKLKANNIATHEVPGELISRQIRFDFKNEAEAAEMLKKTLADFDVTKLTKVELVGEPEIKRDGANAKMTIKVKISPDMDAWGKFSKDLQQLLDKAASRRAVMTERHDTGMGSMVILDDMELVTQLKGTGILVSLFSDTNISGAKTQWKVYRVPEAMEDAIKVAARRRGYRVAFVLLSQDGKEILRTSELVHHRIVTSDPAESIHQGNAIRLDQVWFIGPVWWWNAPEHPTPLHTMTTTIAISSDDLQKVVNVKVSLEKVKGKD